MGPFRIEKCDGNRFTRRLPASHEGPRQQNQCKDNYRAAKLGRVGQKRGPLFEFRLKKLKECPLLQNFTRRGEDPAFSFYEKADEGLGGRGLALLEKCQQVGVDLVRVGCGHPVRKTRVYLQLGVLDYLRGH